MKTTGEFKKLNLVPLKKAVIDPHKGILLRTYYINPHKYLQSTLKSKLEKSYIYISRYNDNIDKAIKNNNIHFLKNEFKNDKSWNSIINRNIDINNLSFKIPKNDLQLYHINLFNFSTTIDNTYLTKSKKYMRNGRYKNIISKNEKIKKKKPKIKVKEQANLNILNLIDIINTYDNANVKEIYSLNQITDTISTGLEISKILTFLNPLTPKLIRILLQIVGKDFSDKYHIGKNLYIPSHYIYTEKEFFISFLTNMIYNSEKVLASEKSDVVSLKTLYYNYFLLYTLDISAFKDMVNNFERNDILVFIENNFENYILIDEKFSLFLKILFKPNLMSVVDDILSKNAQVIPKYDILSFLAIRNDVTPNTLKKLFYLLDFKIDILKNIKNWDMFLRGETDILTLNDILFQISSAKMFGLVYFPFDVYDYVVSKDNPFLFSIFPKSNILINDFITQIKDEIKNNARILNRKILYIPIRDFNINQENISYQLLPFSIAYSNIENISINLTKNIDFVPIEVTEYIYLSTLKLSLISPLSIK